MKKSDIWFLNWESHVVEAIACNVERNLNKHRAVFIWKLTAEGLLSQSVTYPRETTKNPGIN